MTPSDNPIYRYHFGIPLALASRMSDRIKTCVGVKQSKWSEPFNVSKWMGERSKLFWKIEYQSNLSDAQT